MDAPRAGADGLAAADGLAEAQQTLDASITILRAARDRARDAYGAKLARWRQLHERLAPGGLGSAVVANADTRRVTAEPDDQSGLRVEVERVQSDLGRAQADLDRLELALRNVEASCVFLEGGDVASVGTQGDEEALDPTLQMQIIAAQEAERARLAQEIHDGPAQALSNAIFQVEYVERVLPRDVRLAASELRLLRELLRRELGDVRTFITQLRPPVLDALGLDVALHDATAHWAVASGVAVAEELSAPTDELTPQQQTVVLRVVQEALQNVRKHASASSVSVMTTLAAGEWVLEVRDDGRGFDPGSPSAGRRRHFGLQFMRERASLIGARLDVRSHPDGGTVVQLAIPMSSEESR